MCAPCCASRWACSFCKQHGKISPYNKGKRRTPHQKIRPYGLINLSLWSFAARPQDCVCVQVLVFRSYVQALCSGAGSGAWFRCHPHGFYSEWLKIAFGHPQHELIISNYRHHASFTAQAQTLLPRQGQPREYPPLAVVPGKQLQL